MKNLVTKIANVIHAQKKNAGTKNHAMKIHVNVMNVLVNLYVLKKQYLTPKLAIVNFQKFQKQSQKNQHPHQLNLQIAQFSKLQFRPLYFY